MEHSIIIGTLIGFAVSAVMGPFVIPFLLRLKVGQTVRDEGPESHKKKNGTPTMGGIMILAGLVAGCIPFFGSNPRLIPVVILTLGFGLIGFLDDFIKVVLKRSLGLRAWQKMLGQLVVTGIFAWYILEVEKVSLAMKVPFLAGTYLDLGFWNIPLLFFVVIGTVNGTNFTDGLDGLASSVTVVAAGFLALIGTSLGGAAADGSVAPGAGAMVGALLGFLLYNVHPASVFMGDTGSLALGGFIAGMAYALQLPLFIPLLGFIYLMEVVSVILQVGYFKATKGKRIFKMAPIHHHFELCGWSETRVVAIFSIVTLLLCMVAYMGLW